MPANLQQFYNLYHKKNSDFFKVISENNLTYFYILPVILTAIKLLGKKKVISGIDVGCGVGTLAFYLASKGVNMEAYDISSDAIKICKRYKSFSGIKNIHFYCKNVESLSVRNKFDIIVCTEVIEHLRDDLAFIKMLNRFCSKKGYLVISTPSLNAPLYKLGMLDNFDREVGHLRRYTEKRLIKLLKEGGFEIVVTRKVEGVLRNSLFTIKYLGVILKFIKGPLVTIFHRLDLISADVFGESDLIVLARKK